MILRAHIVQATAVSAILLPFLKGDAIVMFLSMIFIDVDHYLDYVAVCKRTDVRGMFKFHEFIRNSKSVYAFSLFHTVEVFLLLLVLGLWSWYFWLILSGFLIHFTFDFYSLYKKDAVFSRAFSIIEYVVIRRRNKRTYPVPPDEFWKNV